MSAPRADNSSNPMRFWLYRKRQFRRCPIGQPALTQLEGQHRLFWQRRQPKGGRTVGPAPTRRAIALRLMEAVGADVVIQF